MSENGLDKSYLYDCPPEEDGVESISEYTRHGFHPIILGDVLPKPGTCADPDMKPRYQIFHKLGYGGFGTVWLARDRVLSLWVSIKVCRGSDSDHTDQRASDDAGSTWTFAAGTDNDVPRHDRQQSPSSEVRILAHLRDIQDREGMHGNNYGHQHILKMYDSFVLHGPNGSHECLVTEVVMPLSTRHFNHPSFYPSPRRASQQIIAGFAFLHQREIIHGDPTHANLGISIPMLQQISEQEMFDTICTTPIHHVFPRNVPDGSLPAYLTPIFSIQELLDRRGSVPSAECCEIKILDFGLASWACNPAEKSLGCTPSSYQPPEIRIRHMSGGEVGTTWSKESDIWAVACLISRIHNSILIDEMSGPSKALFTCCQLGGQPPEEWYKYWDLEKTRTLFAECGYPLPSTWNLDDAWAVVEIVGVKDDRDMFVDLLRQMIKTNPEERAPLRDLLDHPYLDSCCRARGYLTPPEV